jgi:hypothetical protein
MISRIADFLNAMAGFDLQINGVPARNAPWTASTNLYNGYYLPYFSIRLISSFTKNTIS